MKEIKDRVYDALGGYQCKCCSLTKQNMLTIASVKVKQSNRVYIGDGGVDFYKKFIKSNFENKNDYLILCYNCDTLRTKFGQCPCQETNFKCTTCKDVLQNG